MQSIRQQRRCAFTLQLLDPLWVSVHEDVVSFECASRDMASSLCWCIQKWLKKIIKRCVNLQMVHSVWCAIFIYLFFTSILCWNMLQEVAFFLFFPSYKTKVTQHSEFNWENILNFSSVPALKSRISRICTRQAIDIGQSHKICVLPCPRSITGDDGHKLCVLCLKAEQFNCPHCACHHPKKPIINL